MTALVERLAGVDVPLVVAAAALHLVRHAVRARAWQQLVRIACPGAPVSYTTVLAATAVGVAANAALPCRGGQLVRLGLARWRLGRGTAPGLVATLVAEAAIDAVLLIVVLALAALVAGDAGVQALGARLDPVALALALPLLVLGIALASRVAARWRRLRRALGRLRGGLAGLAHDRPGLAIAAGWQAGAWLARIGSLCLLLLAFGVPVDPGLVATVVTCQLAGAALPLGAAGAAAQLGLLAAVGRATGGVDVLVAVGLAAQALALVVNAAAASASLALLAGSAARAGCLPDPRSAMRRARAAWSPAAS